MRIKITFSQHDVARVRDVVASMAAHPMVIERRERNVNRGGVDLAHATIWERHVGCLLTTQQKSSEDSAVQRFIRSHSPLLSLSECEKSGDIARLANSELSAFGGIRRTTVIPKHIAHNFRRLRAGGWSELDALLSPLGNAPGSKEAERVCATGVDGLLEGFGPKQSRNLIQWLGLTQHEIPIDSRILRWLRKLGNSESLALLSSAALGKSEYYCCVMDTIQELCTEAGVLPCMFDASVFASFEKHWTGRKPKPAMEESWANLPESAAEGW